MKSVIFLCVVAFAFLLASSVSAYDFKVCTPEDLDNVRNDLSGHYIQVCDIDLTGVSFEPIGSENAPFLGSYYGGDYSIVGFSYSNSTRLSVGLFGFSNGTLSGINLKDFNVSGMRNVGSLVGINAGVVENVHTTGLISGIGNDQYHIGGVVGYNGDPVSMESNDFSIITDARSQVFVNAPNASFVGGIVGVNNYGSFVGHSASFAEVRGKSSTGGVVGASSGVVSFSYSTGGVIGSSSAEMGCLASVPSPCVYTGGLVGFNAAKGVINRSYANGVVNGYTGVGGILGKSFGRSYVIDSYATGNVSGNQGVGGLIGILDSQLVNNVYLIPEVIRTYSSGRVVGGIILGG